MAVTLRYFTEFGKPIGFNTTVSICGGICARVYCNFVLRVLCRRKENSRSLSHLLMSFLFIILYLRKVVGLLVYSNKWRTESGSHTKLAGHFPPLPMQ